MIIHKSRKKAVCITVAGLLVGIAGGLVLYYVRDVVLGWCFVITAGFALLYGMGSLFDRRPYIVLTEYGITGTVRDPRADRSGMPSFTRTTSISGASTGSGCCSAATTSRSS